MDLIGTLSDTEENTQINNQSDSEQEAESKDLSINPEFEFSLNDFDLKSKLKNGHNENSANSSWDFGAVKDQLKKRQSDINIDETIKKQLAHKEADGGESDSDSPYKFPAEDEDFNQLRDDLSDADEETTADLDLSNVINVNEEKLQDKVVDKRKNDFFETVGMQNDDQGKDDYAQTFGEMNLSRPLLKGLTDLGFSKPTKIQAMTIPLALMGRDICGAASTGSGKTAAFLLPIFERLLYKPQQVSATRVLVLTPTRELAAQCYSVAIKLAKYTDITFALCVGGSNVQQQEIELRKRPDVVIATPGRLIDHLMNSSSFGLESLEIMVIDECDRILEEGFQAELTEIIKMCPHNCQRLLFSATMTDNVDQLIKLSLHRPVRLFLDSTSGVASNLVQEFVRVRVNQDSVVQTDNLITKNAAVDAASMSQRESILLSLCARTYKKRVIVFLPSKLLCHRIKIIFGLYGLKAAELHGNLSQLQRIESLESFRDGKVDFLLCTDLAARGLDIAGIETVINFQMPVSYDRYVHRVGRTARNNKTGKSVTFVGEKERKMVKTVLKNLKPGQEVKQRVIPAEVIKKFKAAILALEPKVQAVLDDEKEEKSIKNAEMQLTKAENLMKYQDEIASKPAKTWFMSSKQKEAHRKANGLQSVIQNQENDTNIEQDDKLTLVRSELDKIKTKIDPKGKFSGLNRKQKRRRMLDSEETGGSLKQKKIAKVVKKEARKSLAQGKIKRK